MARLADQYVTLRKQTSLQQNTTTSSGNADNVIAHNRSNFKAQNSSDTDDSHDTTENELRIISDEHDFPIDTCLLYTSPSPRD